MTVRVTVTDRTLTECLSIQETLAVKRNVSRTFMCTRSSEQSVKHVSHDYARFFGTVYSYTNHLRDRDAPEGVTATRDCLHSRK